jgi:cytochrome b561
VITLHFFLRHVDLIVMAVCFAHRLTRPVPLEAHDAWRWEQLLAKTIRRLFYLILLVSPILGRASVSAHKLAVTALGIVPLPLIAQLGANWASTAGDIHSTFMWLWLIALHAAAALNHHIARRDGTPWSVSRHRTDPS